MATEDGRPGAPDATSLAVLVEVRGTLRQLVHTLEAACRQVGLTEPQQHALLCVAAGEARGDSVTATALLEHLATDKNTMADIVRRLEAHDLVRRERRGRELVLTLTAAGRARFVASLETIGQELGSQHGATAAARLDRQLQRYLAIYQGLRDTRLAARSDRARPAEGYGPPRSAAAECDFWR